MGLLVPDAASDPYMVNAVALVRGLHRPSVTPAVTSNGSTSLDAVAREGRRQTRDSRSLSCDDSGQEKSESEDREDQTHGG